MAQSHHHHLTDEEFQSFRPPQYEEFQNMEFLTHFSELTPSVPVTLTPLNLHNSFISGNQEFPGISVSDNFPTVLQQNCYGFVSNYNIKDVPKVEMQKRKAVEISSSTVASVFDQGSRRKHSSGNGKRKKRVEKEDEKRREVVHVRARRGQATDSHSLAERVRGVYWVRRGKINERLKCLQGIVPGCYKTMGMAMMLDEIINYVQSLQNQVEFLSMKLNAASSFYDFNTESDTIDNMQRAMVGEAKEMERRIPTWHP